MKIVMMAAALVFGLCTHAAIAQTPPAPTAPVTAAPPEAPAEPSAPPPPPAAPKANVVEGTLFRTQRGNGDRGSFVWICTYSVGSSKRSVQFDESCPSTMRFELKR